MANYKWDHIHLRTADPEGTVKWFEQMLGAQVTRSMQNGKPRIDMALGGAKIFIAPVAPGEIVNAVAADLKKKGVEFTKEPHSPRPGIKICFIRGPQGVSIELLDRDPKYV